MSVEVKGVWWRYRGSGDYVLRGVDLRVGEGEFLVVMGRSGAGKTTLLLTINGVIPSRLPGEFKGEVRVAGSKVSDMDVAEVAGYVSTVFEDPEIQFVMSTVEDEVVLGLEALGLPREEIKDGLEWALDLVGLGPEFLGRNPYQLSGGEKQRVAIAAALARKPRVLLLDEPTSDLDPVGKEEVVGAIRRLREELGITIIMVEHNPEIVYEFADRVAVLSGGRIVAEGEPLEVLGNFELKREGVYPPQVVEVARGLGLNGARTEEEVVRAIRSRGFTRREVEFGVGRGEGRVIVSCREVGHVYEDGVVALRGVNLDLRSGELVSVVGPNGSGKTTLAKVIAGLIEPTKGEVLIEGKPLRSYDRQTLSSIVGYVYQNPDHQIFNQTVFDEVAFGLRIRGVREGEVEERVRRALAVFGLEGKEGEHPFFLSKGERRRLALASVYVLDPKVLIVDEPTTGQDMVFNEKLFELLRGLAGEGRCVVVITHSTDLAFKFSDRVVVLKDGFVLADEHPRRLLTMDDVLAEADLVAPSSTRIYRALVPADPDVPLTPEEFLEKVLLG